MNFLEVKIRVPSDVAEVCCRAIEMETRSEALHRSGVILGHAGDTMYLKIRAEDLTALRASLNTYLRWVGMCLNLVGEG